MQVDYSSYWLKKLIDLACNKTTEALGKENSAFPFMKRGKVKQQLRIALALTISGVLVLKSSCALAQSNIVPDGTLGNERSTVTPNFRGLPVEEITGGATRGANLFHSFQEFNVSAGRRAYFFSPNATIQNILARVTGNNPSRILGTLGTFGNSNPNLFLINPNGIIFGQNARLDVGGSFLASTASAVTFPNGIVFSATNPQAPPLLTINVPLGLQFGANPGRIVVQGDGQGTRTTSDLIDTNQALRVPSNQTLALVGGEISLEGATLKTAGGRIELGSVAQNSLVTLTPTQNGFALGYSGVQNFGDIQLSQQATVDASGAGGGDVRVAGRRITITDGSNIEASTLRSKPGGTLDVIATDSVEIAGTSTDSQFPSFIGTAVYPGATGTGGDLTLQTGRLVVRDGAQLSGGTFGAGAAGNLTVRASDSVEVIGTSANGQIRSSLADQAESGATGAGGNVTIETGQLVVQDGAQVGASTFSAGKAGNLTIRASKVEVIGTSANDDASGLFAQVNSSGTGAGGNLTIETEQLIVRDGAQVSTGTFGIGSAGNLDVIASDSVQVIGRSTDGKISSGLFADTQGVGDGGDLKITTGRLLVQDGAQVSTGTGENSQGKGGNLEVFASDFIQMSNSSLFAQTEGTNAAGNLKIVTGWLIVQDGAQAATTTFGSGQGGDLTVNASQGVQLIGTTADGRYPSGLFASTIGKGDAGNLRITTQQMYIQDGAAVSASTFNSGKGGSLIVNASDSVQLIGTSANGESSSGLFTFTKGTGNAGDLRIATQQLRVEDGAIVSASTLNSGRGGSLIVNASDSVQLSGAYTGLAVNATAGSTAGNLRVITQQMSVRNGAVVTVSSPSGQAGNMTIQANSLLLNQGRLFAETALSGSEGGANIILNGLDLLRMDNESLISANALNQANGGNITIDSTLLVATPPTGSKGSDITANATQGKGGAVNITTQGLFGIAFRPKLTPKNDITVTSDIGLNGTFQLTTPDVDPSRGLVNLPTQITDASRQIVQHCRASRTPGGEENKFIITGRGGLPPSPNDPLQNEEVITHWVTLDSDIPKKKNTTPESVTPSRPSPSQLVEAQGWIVNEKGQIVLTASSPTVTPQGEWFEPAKCKALDKEV